MAGSPGGLRSRLVLALRRRADRADWRAWQRRYPDHLVILDLHAVSPRFDPQLHYAGCWTSVRRLRRILLWARREFTLVRLKEGLRALRNATLRGGCMAVTFDDGDVSLEEHAVPLLVELGVPATLFINTAYLTQRRAPWALVLTYILHARDEATRRRLPDDLGWLAPEGLRRTTDPQLYDRLRRELESRADLVFSKGPRFVSREFLQHLNPDQFSVGLHGHEHQRFSMMPPSWQERDLRENIERLAHLPAYVPLFAIPFGKPFDWNEDTVEACRALDVTMLAADGGVNIAASMCFRRISLSTGRPADLIGQILLADAAPSAGGADDR